jgi:hypothetical protein
MGLAYFSSDAELHVGSLASGSHFSRKPARSVVTEQLVVGRRLLASEFGGEFDNYIDLTAEFAEPSTIRHSPAYRSFPEDPLAEPTSCSRSIIYVQSIGEPRGRRAAQLRAARASLSSADTSAWLAMPKDYFNTARCSPERARAVETLWQRLRAAGAITFPDRGDWFHRIGG